MGNNSTIHTSSEYTTCRCGTPVYNVLPTNMRVPLLGECHIPMVPTKWVYDLNQNKTQAEINNAFVESGQKIDNAINTLDSTVNSLNSQLQNTLAEYGSHTIIYYIQPSISNARISADGVLYDKVITCDVYKITSDNSPVKLNRGEVTLTFSIGYNNSSWSTQDEYDWDEGIVLDSTWRTVRIFLYIGGNVDYNTAQYYSYTDIPLIKDGQFDTNFKLWVGDTSTAPNVDSEPWASWVANNEEKSHVGDYYVSSDFRYYKFDEVENGYSWRPITDSMLSTLIVQKSRIDQLAAQITSLTGQIVSLNNKIDQGGSSQQERKQPVVLMWEQQYLNQVKQLSDLDITYDQLEEICYGLRKAYVNYDNQATLELSIIPQSLFNSCSFNGNTISSMISSILQGIQMQNVAYCAIAPELGLCFLFNEQSYLQVG